MPLPGQAAQPVNSQTTAVGLAVRKVVVEQVVPETGMAHVRDAMGISTEVPYRVQTGQPRMPRVGDVWYIDRLLGPWTFSAYVAKDDDDLNHVQGDLSITGNITVDGSTTVNGSMTIDGDLALDDMTASGDFVLGGNLTVGGDITVEGDPGAHSVLLAEVETVLETSGVEFTSIDQGFRDLRVVFRGNRVNDANTFHNLSLRFNGDAGTNYANQATRMLADGTRTETTTDTGTAVIIGSTSTSTGNAVGYVFGYSRPLGICVAEGHGWARTGTAASGKCYTIAGGRWHTQGPITAVQVLPGAGDFGPGTGIQLWGMGRLA